MEYKFRYQIKHKFRGKRIDNGEWIYGYYLQGATAFIAEDVGLVDGHWELFKVDPDTVGQYTGLTDKNGKMIFEGDIYDAPLDFGPGGFSIRRGVVVWDNESGYNWHYWKVADLEVIGNIYDNPELMECDNK